MSKKRAFVRYSKQGKIVPGSLVVTNGTYPQGPAKWNEVSADLCCDNPCSQPECVNINYLEYFLNKVTEYKQKPENNWEPWTSVINTFLDWQVTLPSSEVCCPTCTSPKFYGFFNNEKYNGYVEAYFEEGITPCCFSAALTQGQSYGIIYDTIQQIESQRTLECGTTWMNNNVQAFSTPTNYNIVTNFPSFTTGVQNLLLNFPTRFSDVLGRGIIEHGISSTGISDVQALATFLSVLSISENDKYEIYDSLFDAGFVVSCENNVVKIGRINRNTNAP
jgi:hypothetical protein